MTPDSIMVFAAGFGTRLGDLVVEMPKPMIKIGGRRLIDRTLDLVQEADVGTCIVNAHYKAEVLMEHLAVNWKQVTVSHETPEILDTGGGLRNALPVLGGKPAFTLNADAVWKGANPLKQLATNWNPEQMDALLLLVQEGTAHGHARGGDFQFIGGRRIRRCRTGELGHVYSGAQIVRTEGLALIPDRAFSLNLLWDQMAERGRLFGLIYAGEWVDAGTPLGLKVSERVLAGVRDLGRDGPQS